mgnify:CR=1 FL=1|jgi:DNA-binding transcriptional ArsR family regulator
MSDNDEVTLLDRAIKSRNIDRYYARFLSPSEYIVLRYIHDKTTEWGKRQTFIRRENISLGDRGRLVAGKHLGTGLSVSTVGRALKLLRNRGLIVRGRNDGRGAVYRINYDWLPTEGEQDEYYAVQEARSRTFEDDEVDADMPEDDAADLEAGY